ncbi:hypothetical protein CALVIDRAFT_322312 [Calocera viscosa TUFC12733]|uniref:Secreted protein n=1 Tax=Calocera viscosa (strain TUFC12733) TaxID=1330018 RepID=A0A167QP57_CALVF|nr:hypothetical protein CALVIDRAFT_322312 [Calocera viscosa TUFC12733]
MRCKACSFFTLSSFIFSVIWPAAVSATSLTRNLNPANLGGALQVGKRARTSVRCLQCCPRYVVLLILQERVIRSRVLVILGRKIAVRSERATCEVRKWQGGFAPEGEGGGGLSWKGGDGRTG